MIAAVGIISGLALALWLVPPYQVQWEIEHLNRALAKSGKIGPKDMVTLIDEHRKTLAQIIGGFAVLIGLVFTWRTVLATQRSVTTAQETQITERFTRAIEHLGATQEGENGKGNPRLELRLGGVYALRRIAKDSPKDYWPIIVILTAYIREHAPWKSKDEVANLSQQNFRIDPDIRAVLDVLTERDGYYGHGEDQRIDLSGTNLRGAQLDGIHLENARLSNIHLEKAKLNYAHLKGANLIYGKLQYAELDHADLQNARLRLALLERASLEHANLYNANLERARLQRAILRYTDLRKANLKDAQLQEARFHEAHLEDACFASANLTEAHLGHAHLDGTDFKDANLSGTHLQFADLRKAQNLRWEQINDTERDHTTILPKGIVQATPVAERRARELGVNLSQVKGTGEGGRITKPDVESAANQ